MKETYLLELLFKRLIFHPKYYKSKHVTSDELKTLLNNLFLIKNKLKYSKNHIHVFSKKGSYTIKKFLLFEMVLTSSRGKDFTVFYDDFKCFYKNWNF